MPAFDISISNDEIGRKRNMNLTDWFSGLKTSVKWKKTVVVVTFVIVYALLLLPYIGTILFSIPDADDFSNVATLTSSSIVVAAAERATNLYMNFGGGHWLAVFFSVLLSPLVSYEIESMAYGITMLISFLLFFLSFNSFLRNLFTYEFPVDRKLYREFVILICTSVPLLGFCYPEIFYWFTGAGYAWSMALAFLAFSYTIKFVNEYKKRQLAFAIFSGTLSCMDVPFAVPVVLFHIAIIVKHNGKKLSFKMFIPILGYMCGALVYLLSPGTYARYEYVNTGGTSLYSLVRAGGLTILGALSRIHSVIVECPCSFALIFLIFLLGIWNKRRIMKLQFVLLTFCTGLLSALGALYPVMLGYGICTMPNRICFIFDYFFWITMILTAFSLGQYLGSSFDFGWDKSRWIMVIAIYLFISYNALIPSKLYKESCWGEMFFELADVREEHDGWIEILSEIEQSNDKSVIIKHDRIKGTGILKAPEIGEDKDYWVNAAVARYFEKDSIQIDWQDARE